MSKFVLTTQLNIQAPNLSQVVKNLNKQLGNVSVNLNVPNANKANSQITKTNKNLQNTAKNANQAASSFKRLGAEVGKSIGYLIRYDIARKAINLFANAIESGLSDAIKFERELVKIAQVTGKTADQLKGLTNNISNLSTELGVSSMSLLKASRILAQTGMEADKVSVALKTLAQTTLAPTFDNLTDTTETAIAAMRQFRLESEDLDRVLGGINKVAGSFAVEAGDIGVAIRRAGGAFRSAGGEIEELIALFTSVRSTTRETAETIATGFRTIFTRLQRPTTIKFLEQFGVKLQDLNGKFVGPYEAVRRLNMVLKDLDPKDIRYSMIIEQLGGFRQVSKVIPLIQEFKVAQEALNVAQAGAGSLAIDAAKAQDTFAVKIDKLKEEVKELFRVITESTAFKVMLDGAIAITSALTNLATALGPVIPMLTAMFAIKGIGAIGSLAGGIGKGFKSGRGYARGGIVPGTGTGDTVPAMLTPGEFVIRKSAVEAFGTQNLHKINKYGSGGPIKATGEGLRKYGYGVGVLFNQEGDRDWDHQKGTPWKRSGPVVNQFGLQDEFTATNSLKYINIDGRKLQSSAAAPHALAYKNAKDNLTKGRAWEQVLLATGTMSQAKGARGRPLDGTIGGKLGDAALTTSSHSNAAMAEKLFRHKFLTNEAAFLNSKKSQYGKDTYDLKDVAEFLPSAATHAKLMSFTQAKKRGAGKRVQAASGGAITAQGTDSVPALLTPGEFVINKKSAQSIGYDKLYGINRFAKGGVVGGSRLKMFGGGGPMDMLMMMMGMNMGGMGGGGAATGQVDDLGKTAKETSSKLRAGIGTVTDGLGKVATSSLITYSKIQFMGTAIDSTLTAMGIENETIHKVVGGLTDFASIAFTAGTALSMLNQANVLGGLRDMFGGIAGSQLAQTIGNSGFGTAMRDVALMFGDRLIKPLGRGIDRLSGGRIGRGIQAMKPGGTIGQGLTNIGNMRRVRSQFGGGNLQKGVSEVSRRANMLREGAYAAYRSGDTARAGQLARGSLRYREMGQSAIRGARGASGRGVASSVRNMGRFGRVVGVTTAAMTALSVAIGLSKDAKDEEFEQAKKAGKSWSEVEGLAKQRAGYQAAESFTGANAAVGMARLAARTVGGVLAKSAGRAAVTGTATGGMSLAVEIPLIVAEIAYAAAMFVDSMNNAQADLDAANFAKDMGELNNVMGAFKEGAVDTEVAAVKLGQSQAKLAERESQIKRDENTGSLFGIPGTGGMGFWGRDNDAIAADRDALARASEEQKAMAPEVAASAMEDAIAAMRKGDGTAATGMAAFEQAMGGAENLERIASLMGMEADVLRQKFAEMAKETEPVIQAEKEFAAAIEAMARTTQAATDIIMGIRSMAPAIESIQNRFANIQNQFAGGVGASSSASVANQFSTEAITSISTPAQFQLLADNVDYVAGSLGVAGDMIKDNFLGGAMALSVLPDVLEDVKGDITSLTGDTSDPGERVMSAIEDRLGKAKFDSIPKEIRDRIRTKVNSMDMGDANFEENFDAIMEDVSSSIEPYLTAMQDAAAMTDQYNKILGSAYAQRAQMEMSYIDGQMKIVDLMSQGEDMIREARGGKLTAADSAAQFRRRQEAQLGAGVSTGAVRGAGGQLASGMSVQGLGNLYNDQQDELRALNDQIADSASAHGANAAETQKLREKQSQLQAQTEKTKRALENYTNVQQRAAGIQAELAREQEAREAKRKTLTDFTFASDEDRATQVSNMRVGLQAAAAGNLDGVASEDRAAVGQFLDRFENVNLAAFGGKTGGEIKKEMEIAELEKVMGRSLSADEKKQIMESTSKEDKLINDLRTLNDEAIAAQEALNEKVGDDINNMTVKIADLNREFLTNLQKILGERQKQRLAAEEKKAQKGIADVKADQKAGRSALGLAGLKGLQGKDADRALKTLTANKDQIAAVKEQQEAAGQFKEGLRKINAMDSGEAKGRIAESLGASWFDQEMGSVAAAVRTEAEFKARQFAPGEAREAGMKAASDLESVMNKLEQGMTLAQATEGNAEMLKAFTKQGYDADEGIDEMNAGNAAEITERYMKSVMASGQNAAEAQVQVLRDALAANPLFTPEVIEQVLGNTEALSEQLSGLLPDTTFTSLNEQLTGLNETIANINTAQQEIANMGYSENEPKPAGGMATGGPVYASRGMFIPKGTDTVPAMLTPGEFVIRRNAVKAVGLPLLQRINNMGRGGRQGGNGYYANGGRVGRGLSLDFSGLDASINRFSQQVDKMSQALAGGFSVNVGGEITVNVRLNGAEMLEGAKESLGKLAHDKVTQGITNMLRQHFPQINAGGKGIPGKQEQTTQYG